MENNSLWAILGPIISAVVGAVLGAIVQWWRTRTRPQYLVCEEKARTSLEVIEEAREETEIRYGGSKVARLSLEKLRLFNQGPEVLKGADFTVRLNPEVKIVGIPPCKILPEGEGEIVSPWQEQPPNQNEKNFRVDYLNPFKPYKQEVLIELICDGEITEVDVFGGGPGWSVKFWSLEEKKRTRGNIGSIVFAFAVIGIVGVFGVAFLKELIFPWTYLLLYVFSGLALVSIPIHFSLEWMYRRHGISL